MMLETHMNLIFWKKIFELEKDQKQGVLISSKIFSNFLLNLFYNEDLFYLIGFSTNPIFGKIVVPEI